MRLKPLATLLFVTLPLAAACAEDANPVAGPAARLAPASAPLEIRSFDQSRSQTGAISGQSYSFVAGDAYAPARALVSAAFPGIAFGSGVPAVDPAALADADVFVINPLAAELGALEVCYLEAYVGAGGAVLETRNLGARPALLGTTPGAGVGVGSPSIVSPTSPLVAGPFGAVTAISTGFHSVFAAWGDATVVATALGQPDLLQLDPGPTRTGRAVLIGDEEVFISPSVPGERSGHLASIQNQTLLLNTIAWLGEAPGAAGAAYHTCGFTALQQTLDALAPSLRAGEVKSLQAKVDAALRQAEAGRLATAGNILRAFLHQVSAMERSGRMGAAEAASLGGAAELTIGLMTP